MRCPGLLRRAGTCGCLLLAATVVTVASPALGVPGSVLGTVLAAQEMEAPVDVQLPILLKVMTFDRKLPVRAPKQVVIGVAFQSGNRASIVSKDEALRAIRAQPELMKGVAIRAVAVDLDESTLPAALARHDLTHLYVTPLRATDVGRIADWARQAGVTTMSGVASHLSDGLALGVGLRGGRPRILVNVEASRLEGADLSAELLKLAEIVR